MINLHIIDYYNQSCSGLTTYVNQLRAYLRMESDLKIHYIWAKSNKYKEFKKETDSENVVHYHIPRDIANAPDHSSFDVCIADFLARETANQENIIFHFNWINHCPIAQLLKQKIPCITLLTKHCIPWRDSITSNYPLFRSIDRILSTGSSGRHLHPILMREHLSYTSVDHIICVTDLAREVLDRILHIPISKKTVVHNGAHYEDSKRKDKSALRRKYGFISDEKIILFAGTVNERKGIFDLVASVHKIMAAGKPVRLVIAGGGEHAKLLNKIKKHWSRITITGNLDKKTLYDFYQIADIGVVPSFVEQCSFTAIEMMHSSLPIIVANVDGLKEIVPDNCGLKVRLLLGKRKAHIDSTDMAKKILFLLENEDIAKQNAKNAKKHALKNLTAKRMAAETIEVYKKLVISHKEAITSISGGTVAPLVSILLPCYNSEKYLRECIDSIVSQQYRHFELILIDDGSTDKTANLIQQYRDERIIVVTNETNEGIVNCLNKGIKLAKGKYIARIDADDRMHPDRLKKQVTFLETPENKNISLVGSHHYVIASTGKLTGLKQYPVTNDEIRITGLFQNPFSHPSVMVRTAVMKENMYPKKYRYAEDYALWFRILEKYQVANMPEFLTYYRLHDSNSSRKNNKEQAENTGELLMLQLDKLGVVYTPEELAIHVAIVSNYTTKYFNTPERLEKLNNWLSKILSALQLKYGYSHALIKNTKRYILEAYCGVYNHI